MKTNLEKLHGMWFDMARRLLRFHKGEDWHNIGCWGLANVTSVKKLLNQSLLVPSFPPIHKGPNWFKTTDESYKEYIEPLLECFTLEQLEILGDYSPDFNWGQALVNNPEKFEGSYNSWCRCYDSECNNKVLSKFWTGSRNIYFCKEHYDATLKRCKREYKKLQKVQEKYEKLMNERKQKAT